MMIDLSEPGGLSFAIPYLAIGFCGLAEEPNYHSSNVLLVNFVQ